LLIDHVNGLQVVTLIMITGAWVPVTTQAHVELLNVAVCQQANPVGLAG
jgi:hypothetical protein